MYCPSFCFFLINHSSYLVQAVSKNCWYLSITSQTHISFFVSFFVSFFLSLSLSFFLSFFLYSGCERITSCGISHVWPVSSLTHRQKEKHDHPDDIRSETSSCRSFWCPKWDSVWAGHFSRNTTGGVLMKHCLPLSSSILPVWLPVHISQIFQINSNVPLLGE